jgi:hypothetical protein
MSSRTLSEAMVNSIFLRFRVPLASASARAAHQGDGMKSDSPLAALTRSYNRELNRASET